MIHEATRTLVKSPPEVWEQCSDPESLSRHLNGSFGEIRITRLDPENTVAWEGEHGSGTVTIEPSAWGTRVTLTAHTEGEEEPQAVEVPQAEVPEPEVPEPPKPTLEAAPPPPRQSMMRLLLGLWRRRTAADPVPGVDPPPTAWAEPAPAEPEPPEPEPEPEPVVPPEPDGSAILMAALESMGQAHHRPYSRG
jgi:hypothetical protein